MAEVSQTVEQAAEQPVVPVVETPPVDKAGAIAPEQGAVDGAKTQGEDAAPKTPLEAAKRVMAKEGKPASDAKPQDGTQTPPKAADDKSKAEDDDSKLPFKDHPTWKKVSSENRTLRKAKELNEVAIKELEPKAKTYDDLNKFFTGNNLSKDDITLGFNVMVAVRNDPAKAYALLQPVMKELEAMVGIAIPPDIQARLDAGVIDAETAQELARTRASDKLSKARVASTEERGTRELQAREAADEEAMWGVITSTLNDAEAEWAKSDPDAAKLKPLLNKAVLVNGQMNPPRNAAQARELFDISLREVKETVGGFIPTPRAREGPLPVSGASITSAPVPKSSLDAARAALGR